MCQILSLSGGGFLGLYTVAVLAEIERHTGAQITSRFDLLAGTSIGGIIALALAAGKPAQEILAAFEQHGERIFGSAPPPTSRLSVARDFIGRLFRSKHETQPLRETIEEIVGPDTRIGDLKHPVLIPAVNLSRGAPQIFKTPHHRDFRLDWELKVVDVALATSAAPTYFPLAKIGDSLYTDGGLFANAPDLIALHEAVHFLGHNEKNIRLLSVGTTTSNFSFADPSNRNFGIEKWFKGARLMNVMIASQQSSVDFMLSHRLGDAYLRIDEEQSKEQERVLGLDVATETARRTIKAIARGTVQNVVNNSALQRMLEHQAPQARFYHGPNE